MKKILVLIISSLLLTSCWGEVENISSNNIEDNKITESSVEIIGGEYLKYDKDLVLDTKGLKVIFFYSPGTAVCNNFKHKLEQSGVNEGLTIFEADYDEYSNLRKKYNITEEHSFALVDDDCKLIKKWSGGNSLEDVYFYIGE